tara:strand:- start:37 stop:447 length:411 start_codon:yes stop_codon:yes gene_type:complete
MSDNSKFSFGSVPVMREVPPGLTAKFRFTGPGKIIETELYGEKLSFPISLSYHPSYDTLPPLPDNVVDKEKKEAQLEGQTIECNWQTKCQSAKQLIKQMGDSKDKFSKELHDHYEKSEWELTRFDTGAYWLEVIFP